MTSIRKLPIGVQSFEDLRRKEFLYIDKTAFIWQLAAESKVYFLSRPRRFGKSLFLSTLKAYFLGQKDLFKGLVLEQLEEGEKENRQIWQEYPVLYLDFNSGIYVDQYALVSNLDYFFKYYEQMYSIEPFDTIPKRFENLIRCIYEKTGKQTVILIDEYDKPLLETMHDNPQLNETYRKILKGFYGVLKSCDQYIRFAFLTGVTKFSKVSIFSDLNNLRDISMLPDYAALCGLTQEEMEHIFTAEIEILGQAQGLSVTQTLTELKQQYDGYHFSENSVNVYNPFSILNVFAGKVFRNFWFATGTPTFLVEYLKKAYYYIPDLDGNVLIDEYGLNDYRADPVLPVPILFQAGYLTIKDYNKFSKLYRLGFPNDEVRYGFLHNLIPAYTSIRADKTGLSVWQFYEQIKAGDVEGFMEKMRGIISGIPYDTVTEKDLALREQNYQTAVYLIFALMNQFVYTEVHCATGRADCIVEMKDVVYLFEFKLTANVSAEDALKQIQEKGYADKYAGSGKKIIAIGAGFDKEKRTIKDWKTELL